MSKLNKRKISTYNLDSLNIAPITKKVRYSKSSKLGEDTYNIIDANANAITNEAIEKELKIDPDDEFVDIISIDPTINENLYKQTEMNSTSSESIEESYIIMRNNSISDDEEIDVVNIDEETNETLNIHKKVNREKEETFNRAHSISIADLDTTKSDEQSKTEVINNLKSYNSITKPRRRSKRFLNKSLPVPNSENRNPETNFIVKKDGDKVVNLKSLTRNLKNKKKVCSSDCLADKENICSNKTSRKKMFSENDCVKSHVDKQTNEYRMMRNVRVLLDRNIVDDHFKKIRALNTIKTENDTCNDDNSANKFDSLKYIKKKNNSQNLRQSKLSDIYNVQRATEIKTDVKDCVLNNINTTDIKIKENDINQLVAQIICNVNVSNDPTKSYNNKIDNKCNTLRYITLHVFGEDINLTSYDKIASQAIIVKMKIDSIPDTNEINNGIVMKKVFNDLKITDKDNGSKRKGRQSNLFNYFDINSNQFEPIAKDKNKLLEHIAIEHREELYNCSRCGGNFSNRNSFKCHQSDCGNLQHLKCRFCSYRSNTRRSMELHLRDRHVKMCRSSTIGQVMNEISMEAKAYKVKQLKAILEVKENKLYDVTGKMKSCCAKCNRTFERTFLDGKVVQNCQECSTRLSWKCLKCRNVYSRYRNIWIHVMKMCEPFPVFQCNHCDYVWLHNQTMRTIVRTGNRVECPKCGAEQYK